MNYYINYIKCLNPDCQAVFNQADITEEDITKTSKEGCPQCQSWHLEYKLLIDKDKNTQLHSTFDKCPDCNKQKMIDLLNWDKLANEEFFPKTKEEMMRKQVSEVEYLCQCSINDSNDSESENQAFAPAKKCPVCKYYFTELFEDGQACDTCARKNFYFECNYRCGANFRLDKPEYANLTYSEADQRTLQARNQHEKNECPNRITVISLSAPVEQDNNNPNQNIPFLF